MMEKLIRDLNADTRQVRLAAAAEIAARIKDGAAEAPGATLFTNNHVHTTYSFSPYSPVKAVWMAMMSGLSTVGIVDHDSVSGAREFIEAGQALGIATTVGFEMRTDYSDTPLGGRRINNPSQDSTAYITAHGLPHTMIDQADAFLRPIRDARHRRNRAMTEKLNGLLASHGIAIDYDGDVLPVSQAADGGGVTERHLMYALAMRLMETVGRGQKLIAFFENDLGIALNEKQQAYLADTQSDIYAYDVLNILKSSFVPMIYIDAEADELPPVREAVGTIRDLGAIPTYCYLGDVAASPTGDKKAQTFEDAYLDEVMALSRDIGFLAIAYMPTRNTKEQLARVMALCDKFGFMQISGEDINQPRQSFICKQLAESQFAHLVDTTWALVGHEIRATDNIANGMFADGRTLTPDEMKRRIDQYKMIGRSV
jgi:hypothetical protein